MDWQKDAWEFHMSLRDKQSNQFLFMQGNRGDFNRG